MNFTSLLISLISLIFLFNTFISFKSKILSVIEIVGEIYFGIGIALLGGIVIAYNINKQTRSFFIFIIAGTILLIFGAMMKVLAKFTLR